MHLPLVQVRLKPEPSEEVWREIVADGSAIPW
jgi:hypothetical protein